MVDVQEKSKHQEVLLAIKREIPSFEAQDLLEEVNLHT